MPLDRHARRFLEMLAAAGQTRGGYDDAADRRRALNTLADLVDPPGTVEIGGVRDQLFSVNDGAIVLRTYSPLGKPQRVLPGLVFFHGGGWVAGSLESHDGFCRRLANESGRWMTALPLIATSPAIQKPSALIRSGLALAAILPAAPWRPRSAAWRAMRVVQPLYFNC